MSFWGFGGSPMTLSSLSGERKPERHNQRVRGFAPPRNQKSRYICSRLPTTSTTFRQCPAPDFPNEVPSCTT
jgi:hypothetical protein